MMLFLRDLLRRPLIRIAWWLTTHDGYYTPCDDDHCIEVRNKARWG
jgi:hypothetical protein